MDELAERAEEARSDDARRRVEAERIAGYHGKRRTENLRAWIDHHRRQARLHEVLAAEHRERVGRLIDGGAR